MRRRLPPTIPASSAPAGTVSVSEPEISKAYYGRLPGSPVRYEIASSRPFLLFAQATVPDVPGSRRDLRLRVAGPAGELASLSTPAGAWKKFYEPVGGDHYLTGPEFRRRVPAGRYLVEVSDAGNTGVYVLAVGEAERWGPVEGVRALLALPTIKHDYFGESLARAWFSRTIPALAVLAAAAAAVVLLVRWLVRAARR